MPVFEASVRSPSIAAGGTYNVVFTTGSVPTVFLSRNVSFAGTGYTADVTHNPTGLSGGVVQGMYPTDRNSPAVAKGALVTGVTVSVLGPKIAATSFYRGLSGAGLTAGTFGTAAGVRRLAPDTNYVLQFTNNDAGAQTLDLYLRWYEGPDPTPTGQI